MGRDGAVRILAVVGARPNFMKISPLMRVFKADPVRFDAHLLHTGQHYDETMKDAFFRQLGIPQPDTDLGVGSGTHAVQTAEIMRRVEPVIDELQPDVVLVVGDVNSTIACALVAVKKDVPVVHVEAGLRSGDRRMPEEINRVLTDQISDLLFTTEADAADNLALEGISQQKVHFVGNVMIDTLLANRDRAVPAAETLAGLPDFDGSTENFGLLTLHRPSNVDDATVLRSLLQTLRDISAITPLVFPIHPRTRARIEAAELSSLVAESQISLTEPLGYLQLLGLLADARVVLTDSGGLQEETTAVGVPCITLRENTERPITVTEGTNTVVGTNAAKIRACFDDIIETGGKAGRVPALWDGRAAERIADVLYAHFRQSADAA
jgi:UDP-N-acetylglucosamine 2-epimerase (non-hydrolysing)